MAGLVETMGHGCWGLWVAQWRARVSEECLQLWRAEKGARAKQAQGGAPPCLASPQDALPEKLNLYVLESGFRTTVGFTLKALCSDPKSKPFA